MFKVQALRPHGYIALYLSHIGLFVAWQDKEDLYLKKLGIYIINKTFEKVNTQLTFTCSKLTIETLEKGVEYVQS